MLTMWHKMLNVDKKVGIVAQRPAVFWRLFQIPGAPFRASNMLQSCISVFTGCIQYSTALYSEASNSLMCYHNTHKWETSERNK